jgi:DNA-binding CsgD family transcriptional regulator
MADELQIHELIRLTYECSLDPAHWMLFLEQFAAATGAHAAGLLIHDYKNQRGNVNLGSGFDPAWQVKYADYYASVNPWLIAGRHLFQQGRAARGEEALPQAELEKTEFYHDFLRPQGYCYSMGGAILMDEARGSYISAQRQRSVGSFTDGNEQLLTLLLPHLQTAMRVHHRVSVLETRLLRANSALDELRDAVILADSKARVLFANRRAEELLKEEDGLSLSLDGLRAGTVPETTELRQLIYNAARVFEPGAAPSTGLLSLMRRGGKNPLQLFVAPLPPSAVGERAHPTAAIFVTAMEWHEAPQPAVFEELLGLTPAEARLAAALASGKSIQEYTHESGVMISTTRTHIKRMYSKLGVTRQGDFMRILLSLTPERR